MCSGVQRVCSEVCRLGGQVVSGEGRGRGSKASRCGLEFSVGFSDNGAGRGGAAVGQVGRQ